MRLLVNALSVGSLSGQHVLYGHLKQVAQCSVGRLHFLVLHRPGQRPEARTFTGNVEWIDAPRSTQHWAARSLWESMSLSKLAKRHGASAIFTPAGTTTPGCSVPQICLAQNPWCMVSAVPKSLVERGKAVVQRGAYRRAMRDAAVMVYNSKHIRDLYRLNARGASENRAAVVYQGVDVGTFQKAEELTQLKRQPCRILSVSAMASWKGAETLVRAVGLIRARGIPAELRLVGPWPDPAYAAMVRKAVADEGLASCVTITGKVTRDELYNEYAEATVFCLMSKCESFGIPAVEAQAFGTPVVGSLGTAMPEIGGEGGMFVQADAPNATADCLTRLLSNEGEWRQYSAAARQNAQRFRWEVCSKPLLDIFEAMDQ